MLLSRVSNSHYIGLVGVDNKMMISSEHSKNYCYRNRRNYFSLSLYSSANDYFEVDSYGILEMKS